MSRLFYMPPVIVSGAGALSAAAGKIALGKKALIVTGKIVVKQDCTRQLFSLLDEAGIKYDIFTDIVGEPTDVMVKNGTSAYLNGECDFMIAVGGGSPMDLMKAIAVSLKYPGTPLREFMGKEIPGPFVPMVAIPTTAGTGSEATMFTVITDTETDVKMLLKSPQMIPDVAVVDPSFSVTAPPSVTANTGLDALTHSIEAYTSRLAQPLTDTMAVSAVKRIMKYLPEAYKDGNNLVAREEMALAALEAGVCITNSSVTIVHGMSRPIGALFHVAHGLSNAMLLPDCLEFAVPGAVERFAFLGRETGTAGENMSDEEAAYAFLKAVRDLCSFCNVPTLEEYGIDREEFFRNIEKMSSDAVASGSPGNTRRAVTKEDCAEIYKKLWN